MGKLTRVSLRNFQAHKRLDIAVDPHITIILGDSDCGKSAVVRAIRWVATNRPGGDAFIRHGKRYAAATLTTEEGEVTRTRGNGDNSYTVDGTKLVSFGADVPEPGQKVLRLGDINFQSQHDAPFWFASSAGEVSRELNSIIDLNAIDTILGNLARRVRDKTAAVNASKERLVQAKGRRESLSYASQMSAEFSTISDLDTRKQKTAANADALQNAVALVRTYQEAAMRAARARQTGKNGALRAGEEAANVRLHVRNLEILVAQGRKLQRHALRSIPDLSPVIRTHVQAMQSRAITTSLNHLVEEAHEQGTRLSTAAMTSESLQEEWNKHTGERCPTCGSKIPAI